MQDNTESEKPEDSPENEDHTPEVEETVSPEDSDSVESDSKFEEQEGEFLPPEEKKKSGAGKAFLFLILVLAGSGSYLYFNNLIPPEILNLVFPKSAPSKPLALITQTPPFVEEVIEKPEPEEVVETPTPEPEEVVEALIPKPDTVSSEPDETPHISGNVTEPKQTPHISGNNSGVKNEEEKISLEESQETVEEEPQKIETPEALTEETAEEELQEEEIPEEAETVEEIAEETEFNREPVIETIPPPTPEIPDPEVPQRSKASQAYLDFIESSVQKFGELIKEGFNWCWDYLKRKIA